MSQDQQKPNAHSKARFVESRGSCKNSHLQTLTNPAPILLTECDSLSTLYQCAAPHYSVKARWNHCDLLSHLQASIHANETNHAWMHVPAHQIKKKPVTHLSRNALLNKEMDALASRIMETYPKAAPFRPTVRMPTVHYGKIAITGNICCSLYLHLTRKPVKLPGNMGYHRSQNLRIRCLGGNK